MRGLKFFTILMLIILPSLAQAQPGDFGTMSQVVIRYNQIDWQTYEFLADSNDNEEIFSYIWRVDGKDFYYSPKIQYHFSPGEHDVMVTVSDLHGNKKYDNVRIDANFWSLQNNYLLWFLYAFVVLVILYYWILKLIYLFNERRIGKETRQFFSFLDSHGWVERVINHHSGKIRKTLKKK